MRRWVRKASVWPGEEELKERMEGVEQSCSCSSVAEEEERECTEARRECRTT